MPHTVKPINGAPVDPSLTAPGGAGGTVLVFAFQGRDHFLADEAAANVIEGEDDLGSVEFRRFEHWAGVDDFLAIGLGPRRQGEPITDGAFRRRVDIVFAANVGDDGHAGVLELQRHGLGLPQFGPGAFLPGDLGERRQLHEVEGEVRVLELGPPAFDHAGMERAIFVTGPAVAFALIPDRPFDAVIQQGMQHAVVEGRRAIGVDVLRFAFLDAASFEGGLAHPGLDARAAPARCRSARPEPSGLPAGCGQRSSPPP